MPPDTSQYLYSTAFLRTVLSLNGVFGTPSAEQLTEAKCAFKRYLMNARKVKPLAPMPEPGRAVEPLAVEQAFMFVQFNSLRRPDEAQLEALDAWLAANS